MFLQASVILLTGGSTSVHAGIPPPMERRQPPEGDPLVREPPIGDPPVETPSRRAP